MRRQLILSLSWSEWNSQQLINHNEFKLQPALVRSFYQLLSIHFPRSTGTIVSFTFSLCSEHLQRLLHTSFFLASPHFLPLPSSFSSFSSSTYPFLNSFFLSVSHINTPSSSIHLIFNGCPVSPCHLASPKAFSLPLPSISGLFSLSSLNDCC